MIVDIVQHQNELYHNFHIKDPWRGTTAAQIQNQPNNFIGKYLGNQMISIAHTLWIFLHRLFNVTCLSLNIRSET